MATSPCRRTRSTRSSPYQRPKDARGYHQVPHLDLFSSQKVPDRTSNDVLLDSAPTSFGPTRNTRSSVLTPCVSPCETPSRTRSISTPSPVDWSERMLGLGMRRTLSDDMRRQLCHLTLAPPDGQSMFSSPRRRTAERLASLRSTSPVGPAKATLPSTNVMHAPSLPRQGEFSPWAIKSAVGAESDDGGCGYQEDEFLVVCGDDYALLGVFDGHGGVQAAQYCREKLHQNVLATPELALGDTCGALFQGLIATEQGLIELQVDDCTKSAPPERGAAWAMMSGTTAVAALLRDRTICVGWAGDCRAVLSRDGEALELTEDHNVHQPKERERVVAEGGFIEGDRLSGCLAVTRAFGGVERTTRRKLPGLSGLPEIGSHSIQQNDEFAILASDGLWDVMTCQEAVRIAREQLQANNEAGMASEKLVEEARRRRTDDNVTVLVVCFKALPKPAGTRPTLLLRKKGS